MNEGFSEYAEKKGSIACDMAAANLTVTTLFTHFILNQKMTLLNFNQIT